MKIHCVGSESEDSDKSDAEMDSDKKISKETVSETPAKSSSMPTISTETPPDDTAELDSSIDRSPPKLMKVVDIGKDKADLDDKQVDSTDKAEIKEEPNAPVLKVVELEKSEPILEKIEAQLAVTSPPEKVETEVKDAKEKDVKETKKKEPEKRGRKPAVKVEKEVPEVENPKKVDKVKETLDNETEKVEESLYDFKDEPDIEKDLKIRERKKPVSTPVINMNSEKVEEKEPDESEKVKEEPKLMKGSKDDLGKEFNHRNLLLDEKDCAKSDSEVDRRGRKKKVATPKDSVKDLKNLKEVKANVPVAVGSIENKIVNSSPERKSFITLAEKKQGFSPMVRKVVPPPSEKCADNDSAKVEELLPEKVSDKIEIKEELKKPPDMVVVHKALPVKTDIVLGKNIEPVEENTSEGKDKQEEEVDREIDEVHSVKKKVRKKTKKKLEMEEQEQVVKKAKRGPGARKTRDSSNKEESAISVKDTIDIDLHCEEEIRSRSASPENLPGKSSFIQESQGFVPRIETIDCRISDSQGSDSFSLQNNDISVKSQTLSKSNMFENTPPTTPEHDSDDTSQQNSQNEQIKIERKSSEENSSKTDTSQAAGRESPNGNASPSNRSTGSSSGVIAGSEGSVDMPVYGSKRRRESDEPTPSKRRKRASRGKASRARQVGKWNNHFEFTLYCSER